MHLSVDVTTLPGMATTRERNEAAASRAAVDPHRAILRDGEIVVISESDVRFEYVVGAVAVPGSAVTFRCEPRHRSTKAPADVGHRLLVGPPGAAPCKHSVKAAKRLERDGLIRQVDGVWVAAGEPDPVEDDPFAGLC